MEERFNKKYTISTVKHPPSTQMIWGAMSANYTAGIYFLMPGTTINDAKYVELLKYNLSTHMAIHQSLIFMHDGAPSHWSKIVKQFLTENHIKILDCPGNSPNLNPIENLRSKIKDFVSQRQPGSSSELKSLHKCG